MSGTPYTSEVRDSSACALTGGSTPPYDRTISVVKASDRAASLHAHAQVKKGNLSETSPMLNDISGVLNWEKVNTGLLKMYKVRFPHLSQVTLNPKSSTPHWLCRPRKNPGP